MTEFDYKLTAKSIRGNFDVLSSDGAVLTTFDYQDWFASSGKASYNGNMYELKPKNLWMTSIDVYKNGEDIGDIHFNWKGHIIIKLKKGEEPEKRYVLAAKGFWNFRFVLATQDQQDVLVMTTAFKWSKLHFEYVIKLAENVSTDHDIMELILCCGYGANLYMTTIGNAS